MRTDFTFLALSFISGVGCFFLQQHLPTLNALWWLAGVIFLGLLAYKYRWPYYLILFALGFAYAWLHVSYHEESSLPVSWQKDDVLVVGKIEGLPQRNIDSVRFRMKILSAKHQGMLLPIKQVQLRWYGRNIPKLYAGQKWEFTARLKLPHGRFNHAGFDYEAWALLQGLDATGYVRDKNPVKLLSDTPNSLDEIQRLRSRIHTKYLANKEQAPLLSALLLGDKTAMDDERWRVLRHTGTSHLLAISGLHLGLVAAFAWFGLRRLFLLIPASRHHADWLASIGAWLLASGYALLAGFSIPTQRAWLMLSVVVFAVLAIRQMNSMKLLVLVFLICVLVNPFYMLSAGFWLSFVAVFWIVYVSKLYSPQGNGFWKWAKGLLLIQLVLGFGLIPILSTFGFGISSVSLLANMVALPIISFLILPLLLLGFLLVSLHAETLGVFLFNIADTCLSWLWQFLSALADMPYSLLFLPQPEFWQILSMLLGGLILLLPKLNTFKLLGLFLVMVGVWPHDNGVISGQAKITVVDVGQGLSVLVETKNHNLLYDVGAKYRDSPSVFVSTILPLLRNKGISELDTLILSHGDNDHGGGFEDVITALPVNVILSSTPDKFANAQSCVPRNWVWDGVVFSLVHPQLDTTLQGNNASCVLQIKTGEQEMLLLSDLEKKGENSLLDYYEATDIEVILVPHHGSKTSTTEKLLTQLKPQLGIISSGYQNRYKHPHASVIERLQQHGVQIINTADAGAIEVMLSPDSISVKSYREAYGKFWNQPLF